MTQSDEITIDDIIWSGGGAKSAEWPVVGSWVGGPVQSRPKKYQPTEYVKGAPAGSGKPRTTRDGRPVWGFRVDVQTTMRDPAIDNDDGVRRMHLDKWRQHEAVRNALKEAGVRHIEPGGELWMQWTGEDVDGDANNPAKTWLAKYRPPVGSVAGMTDPEGPPAYQAAPAPPPAPPAPVQSAPPGWGGPTPTPVPASAPAAYTASVGSNWAAPAPVPAVPTPAAQPHQAPPAGPTSVHNVITESVAASLRSQGFDTSAFQIVPG